MLLFSKDHVTNENKLAESAKKLGIRFKVLSEIRYKEVDAILVQCPFKLQI